MNQDGHYKSNTRDTFFNLFEVLKIQETTLGRGPFAEFDEELVRSTLETYEQFCCKELASSWVESDRVSLKLDGDGNVTLPPGLSRSITALYDGEWHMLDAPEHLGGMGSPPSVHWAAFEFAAGANPAAAFYVLGTTLAKALDPVVTDAQRERYLVPLLERRWGATMVLTEPDAGSDVGAGRTRARDLGDGTWALEGVKRYITNGDFDGPENILHGVLARPEGAGPGTKGLSLFLVPKFWVNEDTSLGERNGVYCTNIEDKMGLKGSATCEMTFGERGVARGVLVGEVHNGIRQMFRIIEQARMAVGCKSMSTLSTAYLNALEYAKVRVQGPDLLKATDKTAPRVTIINHPDVRRMLMLQKALAEGMRALCMYTATIQDGIALAEAAGDKDAAKRCHRRNDLLLPMVKGFCSSRVYELLAVSLQCFGGNGYMRDYPIEQYIRDQKIDSLYEGTTHIQSLDLILRKVARDGGATLQGLLGEIETTVGELAEDGPLAIERDLLGRALKDIQGLYGAVMGKAGESLYHVGLQGNRILHATAEIIIGWLLIRQAQVASAALAGEGVSDKDRDFYTGKLASVRFYCRAVFPGLTLARKLVEGSTLELMELPEAAF